MFVIDCCLFISSAYHGSLPFHRNLTTPKNGLKSRHHSANINSTNNKNKNNLTTNDNDHSTTPTRTKRSRSAPESEILAASPVGNKFNVCVRVRPLSSKEKKKGYSNIVEIVENKYVLLKKPILKDKNNSSIG